MQFVVPYNGDGLSGIFHHQFKEYGITLQEKNIVTCSTSPKTIAYSKRNPCLIINNEQSSLTNFWDSSNDVGEYVLIDLKRRSVAIDQYSIKTHQGGYFPARWRLEGSVTGEEGDFTILHQSNPSTDSFSGSNQMKVFTTTNKRRVRFLRLINYGQNANGQYYFNIYRFEIFGTSYGPELCTQKSSIHPKFISFLYLLFSLS